ncbi:anti-sigma factor, partial [Actinotalea sp.]|uniref:anti-sigma factor n=1 Tax=Actinotalea sp. TaxID=1872145 RepID=UPI0035625494
MQHPEPEDLALAALGEPMDDASRAHLDECSQCAEEVASFAGAITVGRSVGAEAGDTLTAPPARVWDRIRTELDLSTELDPGEPLTTPLAEAPAGVETAETADSSQITPPAPLLRDRSSRPAATDGRPSRPGRWLAVAAAAGIVVGGGGVTLWNERSEPAPAVLEAATLDALPDWVGASGEATVQVAADGSRSLVVTLASAPSDGGYHEVWLIDTDVTKLVSLGVLDGTTGSFALPPGLDLGEFPVVDISEEHFDG